jgi:hypothetical protein
LQGAIDAATAAPGMGGTILIPTGTYHIAGPIYIGFNVSPDVAVSLTILGTSGNTTLIQTANGKNLFEVNTAGGAPNDSIGGLTFQDLTLEYASGATAGIAMNLADSTGAENVRLFRLVFSDCPQAVVFGNTLQCSMLQCTITYEYNVPLNVITLGATVAGKAQNANETYIADCIFSNTHGSPPGGSGACFAFVGVDEFRMVNCAISGFQQGIVINPGSGFQAAHLYFENVSVSATSEAPGVGAALLIQPESLVAHLQCVGCTFLPDSIYGTQYTNGGVFIDDSLGGTIDQLRFVSCYSCTWPGPGMQINGGTNIEILGGFYSCNGTQSESPPSNLQAGIAISGGANGIRIIGVACNNSIPGERDSQQYGISVEGVLSPPTPPGVLVRGCDLTGNLTGALDVYEFSELQVTNCAGYNDQAKILATILPGVPTITISNVHYGYYGPFAFYVSGGVGVTIAVDGHVTGLSSGGFVLAPGETATLSMTSVPAFLAVGK